MKPLAKSLHTVTVLVRVALNEKRKSPMPNDRAVIFALDILGLADLTDAYSLAAQAIKQLNKYA